jgi:MerR family transcriptional regulator, light-induced transcriptional regulator
LSALFAAAPIPTRPGRLLAACPPGETHDFSLLMLAFILRRHGWEVVYLGANVPLSRLDSTLQQTAPRLVLSVAQTLHSAAALCEMAGYVSAQAVPLAYGGGIFNQVPALTGRIPGHFLGHELSAVPQVVERLLAHPSEPLKPEPVSQEYAATLAQFTEKEALILSTLTKAMLSSPSPINPRHLEEANSNFTRYITAALALGDIHFLDHSVGWLKGLLENHGMSPSVAQQYYAAYRQAIQQHLGSDGAPVIDWLRLSAVAQF